MSGNERIGFSLRALQRRYGRSKDWWAAQVRAGRLPAFRTGRRRLTVLASDAEECLRTYAVRPSDRAGVRAVADSLAAPSGHL